MREQRSLGGQHFVLLRKVGRWAVIQNTRGGTKPEIISMMVWRSLASVDTHAKRGDAKQAPSLMGSAVGSEADETPNPCRPPHPGL